MLSFLEIGPMQKEVLPSHKLQDHAYTWQNPLGLQEDNQSQINCQNQLRHPSLSHIEQECQESLIQWKIFVWLSLNLDPELVKRRFRGFCDLKFSGLRPFDMAVSLS